MGCVAPESNKDAMGLGQSPSSGPSPSSRAQKVDLGQMWPFLPSNPAFAHPNPRFQPEGCLGTPKLGIPHGRTQNNLLALMEVMAKRLMDGCDVPDGCCEPLPSGAGAGSG